MTAALEQALRGHVGRLAREIGERLALQRGEPPVFRFASDLALDSRRQKKHAPRSARLISVNGACTFPR
jgi:hypothetical protein